MKRRTSLHMPLTPAAVFYSALCCLTAAVALVDKVPCVGQMCSASDPKFKARAKFAEGDISTAGKLKEVLEARSYNNHVIIIADVHLDWLVLVQAYEQLVNRLGMAHVVALMEDDGTCAQMANVVVTVKPSMACVWYDEENTAIVPAYEDFPGSTSEKPSAREQDAWELQRSLRIRYLRDLTVLRAVRMGYNVMEIHPAVRFFEDPYKYLLDPDHPFSQHHLMAMSDTLATRSVFTSMETPSQLKNETMFLPHPALLYVKGQPQDAKTAGPATQILADMLFRQARLLGYKGEGARQYNAPVHCLWTNRGAQLQDAIFSAQLGHPVFTALASVCAGSGMAGQPQTATIHATKQQLHSLLANRTLYHADQLTLTTEWMEVAGAPTTTISFATISGYSLPLPDGVTVDKKNGGGLLPASCTHCQKVMDLLKSDCDLEAKDAKCPAVFDPLGPVNGTDMLGNAISIDGQVAPETYSLMPAWLAAPFSTRGRRGYWWPHPSIQQGRQQVIGYVDPTSPYTFTAITAAMASLHRWDWYCVLRGTERERPFHASTPVDPYPQAIALHPLMDLNKVASDKNNLLSLLRSMALMAQLTNRTVVWPTLPCTLPWLQPRAAPGTSSSSSMPPKSGLDDNGRVKRLPLDLNPAVMPHVRQKLVSLAAAAPSGSGQVEEPEVRCWMWELSERHCLVDMDDVTEEKVGIRAVDHFEFHQAYIWFLEHKQYSKDVHVPAGLHPGAHNTITAEVLVGEGVANITDLSNGKHWPKVSATQVIEAMGGLTDNQVLYLYDPVHMLEADGTPVITEPAATEEDAQLLASARKTISNCKYMGLKMQ